MLSGSASCDGELEVPKIVIENSESNRTNVTAANMEILPVRCNTTNAELYIKRFGSGGRGRCIKIGQNWYTPIEFKALCGRASSNDWTKSIRFGGNNLEKLIDNEILKPHATSCFCAICSDDNSATSPVRLHTPRRRRKRQVSVGDSQSYNYESDNTRNESDNEVIVLDKEVCPQLVSTDGLLVQQPQHQDTVVQNVHQTGDRQNDDDDIFKNIDKVSNKLLHLVLELTDGLVVQQLQQQDAVVRNVYQTEDGQNDDDILNNIDEVSKKLSDLVFEFGINPKKAKELKRQLCREYNKVEEGCE